MLKRLVFVTNLLYFMLYPNLLFTAEMSLPSALPQCGCIMKQYTDKTWDLEVYQTEKGKKELKLFRTNLKSEKEAYKLCKQWRAVLFRHHTLTVPYQALLPKKK